MYKGCETMKHKLASHNLYVKQILHWEPLSILITIVSIILLHFAYTWSLQNRLVAYVASTNESVWEQIKIAFWPELIIAIIYYFKKKPSFKKWTTSTASLLVTTIFIITTFFYTYTGIIGNHFLVIDIAIFVLAVIFGYYMFFGILHDKSDVKGSMIAVSIAVILLLFAAFIIFTNFTPNFGIFSTPQ